MRAVADVPGIKIPKNAHLIREMMAKTLQAHDHAVHFYHLHALDWVDVVNALKVDPKKSSDLQRLVSPSHPMSSPGYFRDIQNRLKKFFDSGHLRPFTNGYWGSKSYALPPEGNLMAATHYLEALDLQKEWVKIHTSVSAPQCQPCRRFLRLKVRQLRRPKRCHSKLYNFQSRHHHCGSTGTGSSGRSHHFRCGR